MSDHDELPKGWLRVTLGTIHRNDSEGIVPMKNPEQEFELFSVPSHATGKPEIVRGADIGSNKQTVRPNTVLLCKINPRINRVWVVNERGNRPQIASTEWIPFSVTEGVVPRYLAYYLQQNDFRDFLAGNASGVGGSLMRVKASTFDGYPFLLAPLNEQRRIVAKIEELFSDLDAGVAALERIRANLKRYRAAVLKAAVEGRLTEEWRTKHPNIEPASKLLERILAERRQKWEEDQLAKFAAANKTPPKGWREKYVEPGAPDTSGLPELPQGWCWASPEQLASTDDYALAIGPFGSNLKVGDYTGYGVPLVFVRNIRFANFGDVLTKFISEKKARELKAHQIESGDVLITKMGDPPGDSCLYPEGCPTAVITADCIKFRLAKCIRMPQFFVFAINSDVVHRQILRITKGVAQQKVSLARFSTISLPLPSLAEQEQIVSEVEGLFSIIAAADSETHVNLVRSARLRQSILKRAFGGRLVPQDPNDEPADKLLERIRQLRESVNMKEGKNRSATRRTCGKVKNLPKSESNGQCC